MSYNKNEIASVLIKKTAEKLAAASFISIDQLAAIFTAFKSQFYSPTFFVRLGLFIFTLILVNSGLGIIAMFLSDLINNQTAVGAVLVITAFILVFLLEYFISTKKHYRSGIDDCLLYSAVVFLITGSVLVTNLFDPLQICLVALPILLAAIWRYADTVASFFAFFCFYASLFLILKDFSWGRLWMPFIYCGISGIFVYLFNFQLRKNSNFYYNSCLKVLKVLSLLTLYGSVNYFVVREINMLLYERVSEFGVAEIPFAVFFLTLTFILPLLYIFFGLKRKDRLLLRTGLGILILSVLTLQYRFEQIQYEYLMTCSGIVLLAVSWLTIRYLNTKKLIYSFAHNRFESNNNHLNAEAIILSQTLNYPDIMPNQGTQFGGGTFGGGGAGSNL